MGDHWMSYLAERTNKAVDGEFALAVEDGYYNKSIPTVVTGNVTDQVIIPACSPGDCVVIKAMLITGEGNQGTARLKVGSTVILPLYFSVANHAAASSQVRIRPEVGEAVTITTEGRSTNETFVGVTYYESR